MVGANGSALPIYEHQQPQRLNDHHSLKTDREIEHHQSLNDHHLPRSDRENDPVPHSQKRSRRHREDQKQSHPHGVRSRFCRDRSKKRCNWLHFSQSQSSCRKALRTKKPVLSGSSMGWRLASHPLPPSNAWRSLMDAPQYGEMRLLLLLKPVGFSSRSRRELRISNLNQLSDLQIGRMTASPLRLAIRDRINPMID